MRRKEEVMKKENRQLAKERREKERTAAARKEKMKKIAKVAVPVALLVILAVVLIIWQLGKDNTDKNQESEGASVEGTVSASGGSSAEGTGDISGETDSQLVDYGAYLTEEGLIKDIKINEYVELYDYSNLTIAKADIEPTDSEIQEAIATALSSCMELNTDSSLAIADGDMINIDYTGYVDGETFEGGSTGGNGSSLTVGSGLYIEGFEDGLIGAAPGEELTLNLTFPENYKNTSLQGRDVTFEVTVNGIYQVPELTDQLVAEHFSDVADSAEAYETYMAERLYKNNLLNAVMAEVIGNSTFLNYPEDYYNNLYDVYVYEYAYSFQYANNQYYQATGSYAWETPYEYYGVTEEEYKEKIVQTVDSNAQYYLVAQAVHEKENLPAPTEDDITAYILDMGYSEENKDIVLNVYGKSYLAQYVMADQAFQYLTNKVQITE